MCKAVSQRGTVRVPKQAVAALVEAMKDSDDVRQRAIRALGRIGPRAKAAVPALSQALKDKNAQVRKVAADALRKIDRDEAGVR
jgi:HEAT repeat protein